ncbi:hypothetical protein DKP85_07925 [Bacillus thuringiensis]|nr:hypothetical protein [Bacillus toyonensis biovar Thuringiensis]
MIVHISAIGRSIRNSNVNAIATYDTKRLHPALYSVMRTRTSFKFLHLIKQTNHNYNGTELPRYLRL